jgi:hypothetical protein
MTRVERLARDSSLNFASKESSQVKLKIAPPASPPPVPPQSNEPPAVTPPKPAAAAAAPKATWTPGYEGLQSPTQRAALLEEVLTNIESL